MYRVILKLNLIQTMTAVYFWKAIWLISYLFFAIISLIVLKMCRDKLTRKSVTPKTSILDPKGVYVIKPPDRTIRSEMKNKNGVIRCNSQSYEKGIAELKELDTAYPLYLWKGNHIYDLGEQESIPAIPPF